MTSRRTLPRKALAGMSRTLRSFGGFLPFGMRRLGRHELMGRIAEVGQGLLREFRFEGRDLSRLALNGLVGERLTFVRCRFHETDLSNSNLREIRISDCDCRGLSAVDASWTDWMVEGCDLSESDLSGLSLSGSCSGIRLQSSLLTHAHLDEVNLYGAVLSGADLRDASLVGAVLEEAACGRANFFNTVCRGTKASNAVFDNAVCIGADFRNADLRGASFDGCQARVADFRSARLDGATFRGADLGEADFTAAETREVVFDDARRWNVRGLDLGEEGAAR